MRKTVLTEDFAVDEVHVVHGKLHVNFAGEEIEVEPNGYRILCAGSTTFETYPKVAR